MLNVRPHLSRDEVICEATLEFGVRLLRHGPVVADRKVQMARSVSQCRPRGAVLGHYLHTCRVTVADDDTFPTNRSEG